MALKKIICTIFLCFSIFAIVLGLYCFVERIAFLGKATSTEGIVTNLIEEITTDDNQDSSISYRPEIQFQTKDKDTKTFLSSSSSNPPQFSIGSKVDVLYYRGEEIHAEVNSFLDLWLLPISWLFIGVMFGIGSLLNLNK